MMLTVLPVALIILVPGLIRYQITHANRIMQGDEFHIQKVCELCKLGFCVCAKIAMAHSTFSKTQRLESN